MTNTGFDPPPTAQTHEADPPPHPPPVAPRPSRPARLVRSERDRMVGGVCGGLGHYFAIDPVWFRIGFVLLAIGGGSSVLLYVLLWIVLPEAGEGDPDEPTAPLAERPPASVVVGLVLLAVGGMLLVNLIEPGIGRFFWPVALVIVGAVLIMGGRFRDAD